jgi:hypothetical protein
MRKKLKPPIILRFDMLKGYCCLPCLMVEAQSEKEEEPKRKKGR